MAWFHLLIANLKYINEDELCALFSKGKKVIKYRSGWDTERPWRVLKYCMPTKEREDREMTHVARI